MRFPSFALAAVLGAAAAAPARAAEPVAAPAGHDHPPVTAPSREAIQRQIAQAEAGRGGGVVGIVFGALAVVAGVASLVNEVEDESDRDEKGYTCGPSSCENDLDEEPDVVGFYAGFVAGAGLIALGTVGVVQNNKKLRRLRQRERRLQVGWEPSTGAATVAWTF